MPIYIFDSNGNPVQQRPINHFDNNGNTYPIRFVYHFDSNGNPYLVYASGPDWLVKYQSGESALWNTPHLTAINGAKIGFTTIPNPPDSPWSTIWGILMTLAIGDTSETKEVNQTWTCSPSSVDLIGAKYLRIIGTGYSCLSVHGNMTSYTQAYAKFGNSEVQLFNVTDLSGDGDYWTHKEVSFDKKIDISQYNTPQPLTFRMVQGQRTVFEYANSFGVINLSQILVEY